MRRPGIEPGTHAWKACMLTITPPTLMTFIGLFAPYRSRTYDLGVISTTL